MLLWLNPAPMRTRRLLSLSRYLACRRIFRNPWQAHVKLAYTSGLIEPFELTLRDGTTFRLDQPKKSRALWDVILQGGQDPRPVEWRDGMLVFSHDGCRVHLRLNTVDPEVFREVCIADDYKLKGMRDLDTVVELGGQVGMFTTRAAAIAKRVFSLEPHPESRAVAERNIAACKNPGAVKLLPVAGGRTSGEKLTFYMNPANVGASSLLKDLVHEAVRDVGGDVNAIREINVETLSLPDLFARENIQRCSLLKCDIEGGEWEVFAGCDDDTLRRIDRIEMEIHTQPPRGKDDVEGLKQRLESTGFRVEIHNPIGKEGGLWAAMLSASR